MIGANFPFFRLLQLKNKSTRFINALCCVHSVFISCPYFLASFSFFFLFFGYELIHEIFIFWFIWCVCVCVCMLINRSVWLILAFHIYVIHWICQCNACNVFWFARSLFRSVIYWFDPLLQRNQKEKEKNNSLINWQRKIQEIIKTDSKIKRHLVLRLITEKLLKLLLLSENPF